MQSDIIDKILILLMIMILPIGVFFASNYQQKLEKQREEEFAKEQMEKVTAAVNAIQTQAMQEAKKEIEIQEVYYATQSGKLVVKGFAPKANMNIMVSAVLSAPSKSKSKTASKSGELGPSNVLGQEVEVVAVSSNENGDFAFVKEIDEKSVSMVDLRFDQDQSSATVQFDMLKKREIN